MTSQGGTCLSRGRTRTKDGVILLRDGYSSDDDDREATLLKTLKSTTDVSLRSDALIADATTWRDRLRLDPARTNLMRAFTLPKKARVLEVGAGCGIVTRYLGELGASVDALESDLSKARVARERCRDLPRVEVFSGEIYDIPSSGEYDLVVVMDLADHHNESDQSDCYSRFLQACADQLSSKGSLILATSNKLGAKYLAGAPNGRASRKSDSLEPGPFGGSPRAVSRVELESLVGNTGLSPRTFAVFPNHFLTRVVASPSSFPKGFRHLLNQLPDDGWAWEPFVEAGLATDTANSLVVLAGKGRRSSLWTRDLAACYFSLGRRPIWSTVTRVRVSGDSVVFEGKRLYPGCDEPPIRLREYIEPAYAGIDLVTFCQDADDTAVSDILGDWSDMLEKRASSDNEIPLDLVPHNLILQPDGTLAVFDEEWMIKPGGFIDMDHVHKRGVLWLAARVCQRRRSQQPASKVTVRDQAIRYGAMIGLPKDGSWLDHTLSVEARFQALVYPRPSGLTQDQWSERFLARLTKEMTASPSFVARLARFLLPPGSRRKRLASRIAARVLHLR